MWRRSRFWRGIRVSIIFMRSHTALYPPQFKSLVKQRRHSYADPLGHLQFAKARCHVQAFVRRLQMRNLFYRHHPLKI